MSIYSSRKNEPNLPDRVIGRVALLLLAVLANVQLAVIIYLLAR